MNKIFLVFFVSLWAMLLPFQATVIEVNGKVQHKTSGEPSWQEIKSGDILKEASQLRTGQKSEIRLRFDDGSEAHLQQFSTLSLKKLRSDDAGVFQNTLRLYAGKIRAKVAELSSPQSAFAVETPHSLCGVRGTDFIVDAAKRTSRVYVISGRVETRNILGKGEPVVLNANQYSEISKSDAPSAPAAVPQEIYSEWALPQPALPNADLVAMNENPQENIPGKPQDAKPAEDKKSENPSAPKDEKKEEKKEDSKKAEKPKAERTPKERKKEPWKAEFNNCFNFGLLWDNRNKLQFLIGRQRVPFLDPLWIKLIWQPEFFFGNSYSGFGFGLYIPIISGVQKFWYNPGRWHNSSEWDFNGAEDGFHDILMKFVYIRMLIFNYYMRMGSISVNYGTGYIVNDFSNSLNFPAQKIIGLLSGWRDKERGFHLNFFLNDIFTAQIFGLRGEIFPFAMVKAVKSGILKKLYIGTVYAQDIYPVDPAYLTIQNARMAFNFDDDAFSALLPGAVPQEPDISVKHLGFDLGMPLLDGKKINLHVFGNLGLAEVKGREPLFGVHQPGFHYGPGFSAGARGALLLLRYRLEFLYNKRGFIPEYYDSSYGEALFRMQKFYSLVSRKNQDSIGWNIISGIKLGKVGAIDFAFQEYYDADDYTFAGNKMRLSFGIDKGVIPFFYAGAFYERTDVAGSRFFQELVTEKTKMGADLHLTLGRALELIFRYQRMYAMNGAQLEAKDSFEFEFSATMQKKNKAEKTSEQAQDAKTAADKASEVKNKAE
ncbi:MAG: hypothetical protein A2096_10645 [Spirochaetes bacterium GWF1_41_5]|nr:MAG: hypothetical protein A2096_10645 [Spirochaetes bacterium GWF1_41_5]